MTEIEIARIAKEAGLPKGWYMGPGFDDDGNLIEGMPPPLKRFVELVQEYKEAE